MANQGQNAANNGDILKHPFFCEVTSRSIDAWKTNITYAETHAGKGIYSSTFQTEPNNHILNLYNKYRNTTDNERRDICFHTLHSFWTSQGNIPNPPIEVKYPGSPYQAASILQNTTNFDIRLTEYDPENYNHLKTSIKNLLPNLNIDEHIINDSFQKHINWLTEKDNLILFVDPFGLNNTTDCENRGFVELETFQLLINKMLEVPNKNAVLGFWYPANQHTNIEGLPNNLNTMLKDQQYRQFYFGIYNLILLGFNTGVGIVKSLPKQEELQQKWFNLKIKEKDNI